MYGRFCNDPMNTTHTPSQAESAVSGLLRHALAPEAQHGIFLPWIQAGFAASLPLLTQVNQAHLAALDAAGLIDRGHAAALAREIAALDTAGADAFALDGALEDVYFNYEAELIRRVGPELGGRLHLARSRNDLQSTLDRMRARDVAVTLLTETLRLRRALLARADGFLDCVMPGYTHMQHAQPITYGFYLLGIEQSLQRDTRRLLAALQEINYCPLGAGALAGNPFAIDRKLTAVLLGFDAPVPHTLDAVASKDALLELLIAATFVATTFGRLAQDFYFMSTFEVGTLALPDSLAITSSMMPQKKNQAVLEFLKGRQAHLLGAAMTGFAAFRAAPFTHVLDSNADGLQWLWAALDGVAGLLPVVRLVVEGAEPQRARMAELAAANFATATDFADLLVHREKLPFRDAHHVTGRVVRRAIDQGIAPAAITPDLVAQASQEILGHPLHLDAAALRDAFDPAQAVARRVGCGGPSPTDARQILDQSRVRLADDDAALLRIGTRLQSASRSLADAVAQLQR